MGGIGLMYEEGWHEFGLVWCGFLENLRPLRCFLLVYCRVQRDSWSWSWNSRLGLSRPSIGLGLDRIFKSRPVLVLVLFEILFQDKSWSWSHLKFTFKLSLGIGLKREKNQDLIKTKEGKNKKLEHVYSIICWQNHP